MSSSNLVSGGAKTSCKSSGQQANLARQTVQVGGGLLDRTTFKMYDIKKDMTVYAAATEVSHEVTNTVYRWYGSEPPGDDKVADCWIFPTGGVSILGIIHNGPQGSAQD